MYKVVFHNSLTIVETTFSFLVQTLDTMYY